MGTKLTDTQQKIYDLICKSGVFNKKKLASILNMSITNINSHLSLIYKNKKVDCLAEMVYKHWKGNFEYIKAKLKKEI